MSKVSCNINFLCRQSKATKKGYSPIEMSITLGKERVFLTLPRKEQPEFFHTQIQSKKPNDIKLYCEEVHHKAQNVIASLMMNGEGISARMIKEALSELFCPHRVYTTIDLFEEFMEQLKKRSITQRTWMKYVHMQERFLLFYDGRQTPDKITKRVIENFMGNLLREFKSTTVSGYLCKLKSVIKLGIDNNNIKGNPFYGVKIPRNICPIETFTEEEFNRIYNAVFRIERVRKVQEVFLFACGSGLSYVDVIALEPVDFQRHGEQIYIEKRRIKTGVKFYSVLLPCAVEIATKYNFDLSQLKMSNQKMNQTLDDIQIHCNITSIPSLTFHKARHYYITALIRKGVPIAIVQKCAGHSKIEQTLHYVHLCTEDIVNGVIAHL